MITMVYNPRMSSHFGRWVSEIRGRLGQTQQEFAETIGLTRRETIRKMELKATPDISHKAYWGLMDLLKVTDEKEFERMWKKGIVPANLRRPGPSVVQPASFRRGAEWFVRMRPEAFAAIRTFAHPYDELEWLDAMILWILRQDQAMRAILLRQISTIIEELRGQAISQSPSADQLPVPPTLGNPPAPLRTLPLPTSERHGKSP